MSILCVKKLKTKATWTVQVDSNLQNHPTFHPQERLVNFERRRNRFISIVYGSIGVCMEGGGVDICTCLLSTSSPIVPVTLPFLVSQHVCTPSTTHMLKSRVFPWHYRPFKGNLIKHFCFSVPWFPCFLFSLTMRVFFLLFSFKIIQIMLFL